MGELTGGHPKPEPLKLSLIKASKNRTDSECVHSLVLQDSPELSEMYGIQEHWTDQGNVSRTLTFTKAVSRDLLKSPNVSTVPILSIILSYPPGFLPPGVHAQ